MTTISAYWKAAIGDRRQLAGCAFHVRRFHRTLPTASLYFQ
jgi:hypothetical protein